MNLKNFELTNIQKDKLIKGIKAAMSIPFIDSLEDFIWEGIFCYAKNLSLPDPMQQIRSKRLFDIVDDTNKIGWSAKAVQWSIKQKGEFELVIQRADIFKKCVQLGMPNLNIHSDTNDIGKALRLHWTNKVLTDASIQNVEDKRVCILIKSVNKKQYAYFETELDLYDADDLEWKWTDGTKTGLQGIRKEDNFCVYRWYPNQKQFFERFQYDADNHFQFDITPQRVDVDELIDWLNSRLKDKP